MKKFNDNSRLITHKYGTIVKDVIHKVNTDIRKSCKEELGRTVGGSINETYHPWLHTPCCVCEEPALVEHCSMIYIKPEPILEEVTPEAFTPETIPETIPEAIPDLVTPETVEGSVSEEEIHIEEAPISYTDIYVTVDEFKEERPTTTDFATISYHNFIKKDTRKSFWK